MLSINTNIFSLTAQAALSNTESPLQTSMNRLSTGLRINSAADDAAGLAIATGLSSQINGMNTAITNANNGVGLLQTAQGALTSITNNLQTIRELAVESANATNTPADRSALNTESQQLIAEIDRVASSTTFNNVNLLDGSFTNSTFQVGANAGQTISIASISSARTTALQGSSAGFAATAYGAAETILVGSASTYGSAPFTTLSGGVAQINGVSIGSSVAGTVSADQTDNSAWALANAINAANVTGVHATAGATIGTSGTVAAAVSTGFQLSAGAVVINGVQIGSTAAISVASTSATANETAQGESLANAINLMSKQTGVTASADQNGAITLTSAEGGQITWSGSGATYGMGANATQNGSYTLTSTNGGITISGQTVNTASAIGLATATYVTDMAGSSGSSLPASLTYGDLTINGVNINTPGTGAPGQTSDSAWALAQAINQSTTLTGVTAQANATTTGQIVGSITTFTVSVGAFQINGVTAGSSVVVSGTYATVAQEGAAVAQVINNMTSETGVTATSDSVTGALTLTATDGRDIVISASAGGVASAIGLGSGTVTNPGMTYQGSISLSSTASSGIVIGGTNASDAGLTAGTYAATVSTQIQSVAQIDISTVAGANAAISTIDAALNKIDLSAANLGAYQNRFQSAVTTLQNTSDNLTSAKSNIMDADYAVETSNLTKALIAQQAGISILAQANTIPQQILALLPKG